MFVTLDRIQEAKRTHEAIDAALEAAQDTSHRKHLGASEIGKPCDRALWYKFRWTQDKVWDGRMLRLFNRGHLEEFRFVAWLRSIGLTVWEHDPETPEGEEPRQIRVSDHAGHFGGSLDGIVDGLPEYPDEAALTEFKTHSLNSFKKVKESGVRTAKPEHFAQMQIYMHYMDLVRALYMAICKNDDALHCEIIERKPHVAKRYIDRAGRIIWADAPPPRISETPANPACKFCDFARLCHFGGVMPARNCRTCKFSRPTDAGGGQWACDNTERLAFLFQAGSDESNGIIEEERQRSACAYYEPRPDMLDRVK